jgi:2-aminoadipate transaminase
MRLGWIQTSPALRKRLMANGFINSGGSINHISSHIVRLAMDLGLLNTHIEFLRKNYRNRVEAMDAALRSEFSGIANWQRPDGGYFFWLTFDASVDTLPLREKAREREVGFQAGALFSSDGQQRNCLRLSFAHYNEHDIQEGVARLRSLF